MIRVGMDLGTASVKVVFAEENNLLWARVLPTTPQYIETCGNLFKEGLRELSLKEADVDSITTTGYGKFIFPGAKKMVDEISANARGAHILSGKTARTIINIGGQDVKIIKISPDGKVADFKMNDKCAAGTGRFFEMTERILNIPLREFGDRGLLSRDPVPINSICAVFAETEIVSLLSGGRDVNDIIAGLHKSIAKRILALAGNFHLEEKIYLDGGPAVNRGLLLSIKEELGRDIGIFPKPQFTAAFGAALI